MAYKIVSDTYLQDIADAIRYKKGTVNQINVIDMPEEILSIPSGEGSELIINNGVLHNAISKTGVINANTFVKLSEICNISLEYHGLYSDPIWWIEKVNTNQYIIVYKHTITNTKFSYPYQLVSLSNNTLNLLDSGTLKHPKTDTFGTVGAPSRIYKAPNNNYFYQVNDYLLPFVISNNKLVFGNTYYKSGMILSESTKTAKGAHYYEQNLQGYGTYGEDYVIMSLPTTIGKFRILVVKIKNNVIENTVGYSKTVTSGNTNPKLSSNIFALNAAEGKYFISWTEKVSTSLCGVISPLSVSINDSTTTVLTGNADGQDALYYEGSTYNIVQTNRDNEYYCLDISGYLLLNNTNAGYKSKYSSIPTKQSNFLNAEGKPYTPNSSDYNGISLFKYTHLKDNYYGWLHYSFNKDDTRNYELVVVEEKNNKLYYKGNANLITSSNSLYASLAVFDGKLWVRHNATDLYIYNFDLDKMIVETIDATDDIYGVSRTPITSTDGVIYEGIL